MEDNTYKNTIDKSDAKKSYYIFDITILNMKNQHSPFSFLINKRYNKNEISKMIIKYQLTIITNFLLLLGLLISFFISIHLIKFLLYWYHHQHQHQQHHHYLHYHYYHPIWQQLTLAIHPL